MNEMKSLRLQKDLAIAALALATAVAGIAGPERAEARGATGPFQIALRFTPQESVRSSTPNLAFGITDRPVRLVIEDGRAGADPRVLGQTSDHDDKLFPLTTSSDVVGWASEVLQKTANDWGIKTANGAPLTLVGKLTRFSLNESTKAVGSMYNAEVNLSATLKDARGATLWEGTAGGDAARYGKSRSEDNANEVLSDAVKSALSDLFGNSGLQSAWLGKKGATAAPAAAAAPASPAVSPAELLAELVKLKKQGFTDDLLIDYVNKKSLSRALSADDMVKWKQAGMPPDVIKAALARSGS